MGSRRGRVYPGDPHAADLEHAGGAHFRVQGRSAPHAHLGIPRCNLCSTSQLAMKGTRVPHGLVRENGFTRDVLAAYREAVRRYGSEVWVTGITISLKETAGELDTGIGPVIAI